MGDSNYLSDSETLQKPFRALALAPWRRRQKIMTIKKLPMSQQIHKADGNTAVNIEDKIRLLAGGDLLHLQGVLQQRRLREVLQGELLDQRDALVRIVDGLDAVADAHDQLALLARLVDKLHGNEAGVEGLGKHGGRTVQCTTKPVALRNVRSAELVFVVKN